MMPPEIRSGELDRDEAIALVNRYDGEFPERWSKEIFEYLKLMSIASLRLHNLNRPCSIMSTT